MHAIDTLRGSLIALANDPANTWTFQDPDTHRLHAIHDIEVVTPEGMVAMGTPFMYRIDDNWVCNAAPLSYVFPQSAENPLHVPRLRFIDHDKVDPLGIRINVLYKTLRGQRKLVNETHIDPNEFIYVLRIYHSVFVHCSVSAPSINVRTTPLDWLSATPWELLRDGGGNVLYAVLLRWLCENDRNPSNKMRQHVDIAHRGIPFFTIAFNVKEALQMPMLNQLKAWLAEIPYLSPYAVETVHAQIMRDPDAAERMFEGLAREIQHHRIVTHGKRNRGRPLVARSSAFENVVPWKASARTY